MPADALTRRRAALAGGVGNVVEWYDWSVYATFAVYFGHQFFPQGDPAVALIQTFAVFAVGFIARPVGAVTLGRITDRLGRRATMTVTVMIMAATSLIIGIAPTAETIGLWAAVLLVTMRLVQGLALGAETGAVGAFLSESAGARGRGALTSVYAASAIVGTLFGTIVGLVLTIPFSHEQMSDFGWRIPFILGGLLGLAGFYIRRSTEETLDEEEAGLPHPLRTAWRERRADMWRTLLVGSVLGVVYFTFVSGFPSVAILLGANDRTSYAATSLGLLVSVPLIWFFGRLSDRIGRRRVLLGAYVTTIAIIVPVVALMWDPSASWKVYATQLLICVPISAVEGVTMVAMIERFPPGLRGSGFGFAWALSMALFGGTGPVIASFLASRGITFTMSAYAIAMCVVAGVIVWRMRETAFDERPWEDPAVTRARGTPLK